MKWLIVFCVYCMLCTACKNNKPSEDILSIDSMTPVMWDMLMAGEYTSYLRDKDTSKNFDSTKYYTQVLELHKITKTQFYKSYDYYKQHPELNKVLLDSLSNYSDKRKDENYQNQYGKRNYIKQSDSARKQMLKRDSLLLKNKVKSLPVQ